MSRGETASHGVLSLAHAFRNHFLLFRLNFDSRFICCSFTLVALLVRLLKGTLSGGVVIYEVFHDSAMLANTPTIVGGAVLE